MSKIFPKVGDELYLYQHTGSYYVDLVKRPYTVVEVTPSKVIVQSCKLIAPIYHCCGNKNFDRPDLEGQRVFFYDTIAEKIEADPNGKLVELFWKPKMQTWGTKGYGYPEYAKFGKYEHFPYLN